MKLLFKKGLTNLQSKLNKITPGKYYHFVGYRNNPKYTNEKHAFEINGANVCGFCENDLSPPQREWFTTDKNSIWYIWDYFYTPQEERKIKLEKLNETTL